MSYLLYDTNSRLGFSNNVYDVPPKLTDGQQNSNIRAKMLPPSEYLSGSNEALRVRTNYIMVSFSDVKASDDTYCAPALRAQMGNTHFTFVGLAATDVGKSTNKGIVTVTVQGDGRFFNYSNKYIDSGDALYIVRPEAKRKDADGRGALFPIIMPLNKHLYSAENVRALFGSGNQEDPIIGNILKFWGDTDHYRDNVNGRPAKVEYLCECLSGKRIGKAAGPAKHGQAFKLNIGTA